MAPDLKSDLLGLFNDLSVALDNYSDIEDDEYGPIPNWAMELELRLEKLTKRVEAE